MAKLVSNQAVNEKIDGRIQRQQRVGGRQGAVQQFVGVERFAVLVEFLDGDGDAETDVGEFAHDEHADDDDQRQRDVLALPVTPRQISVTSTHLAQRSHQTNVETDENEKRPDLAEHEVTDCLVDDEVPLLASQLGRLDRDASVGLALDDAALEEHWHVVENGDDDDGGDGRTSSGHRPHLAAQRHANGDEPIDGDQQHDPDRDGLGNGRQRPNVRFDVRERAVQRVADGGSPRRRRTVGGAADAVGAAGRRQTVDGFDRLNEDAGDEIQYVDDCQRLEKPVGCAVLIAIASQNNDRQTVTDETDQAEQTDDEDVDDNSIRVERLVAAATAAADAHSMLVHSVH